MTRLWLDVKSPSDAHVIAAFYRNLSGYDISITVRDRAEAIEVARGYGLPFKAVGRDDARRAWKIASYARRMFQLRREVGNFDASLSFNNLNAIFLSKVKMRPSITLMDNDLEFEARRWSIAKRGEMAVNLRATRILCPDVLPLDEMVRLGAHPDSIVPFDGIKEDIYVADFKPDPAFKATLPFEDYVVIRPEARSAVYVREKNSLVPDLVSRLTKEGKNVVYLPRVPDDRKLVDVNLPNVHVPSQPPNGLQLAWHATAVLTGSGSFAREAASLGAPAVSFFPGRLLAVDKKLVNEGTVYHSRDPTEIVEYVLSRKKTRTVASRSRRVRDFVMKQINDIIAGEHEQDGGK